MKPKRKATKTNMKPHLTVVMFAAQSRAKEADHNQVCSQPLTRREIARRLKHFSDMPREKRSMCNCNTVKHTLSHIQIHCLQGHYRVEIEHIHSCTACKNARVSKLTNCALSCIYFFCGFDAFLLCRVAVWGPAEKIIQMPQKREKEHRVNSVITG